MFVMLVGCPGSGKSTWAKEFAGRKAEKGEEVYIVSSDAIRGELWGDESIQGDPKRVFEIAHKRVVNAMESGYEYVIFDATNIRYKDRMSLMDKIAHIADEKRCIIFAEPYEILCQRNESRERTVPKEVIWRMITNFEVPLYTEGFDDIRIHNDYNLNVVDYLDRMIGFNQDNPNHSLDLYNHCSKAKDYIYHLPNYHCIYNIVAHAALLHDIGKPDVKTYFNAKGERTTAAHYYNHQNVGGYLMLLFSTSSSQENRLLAAQLVCYHMVPYFANSEAAQTRWKNRLGKIYDLVMLLHEADEYAH